MGREGPIGASCHQITGRCVGEAPDAEDEGDRQRAQPDDDPLNKTVHDELQIEHTPLRCEAGNPYGRELDGDDVLALELAFLEGVDTEVWLYVAFGIEIEH